MEGLKRAAVFTLLRHNNKWLLLKRSNEPHKNKFVPVGGKIDSYETPHQAAVRETFEETGLKVTNLKYCGSLVETSPINYNWISFIYLADIDDVEPPECNEGTLQWISNDDLLNIETPPTDLVIYKLVSEGKQFALNAEFDEHLNLVNFFDELGNIF